MKTQEIKLSRKDFVTNYPHFRYWKKNAAEEMMTPEPLNIYIHVPFCMQKCAYCYYKTETFKNKAELAAFAKALEKEIEIISNRFNLQKRKVNSIYIGGGTPTLLDEDMINGVVESLHRNFTLDNPEFTMEAEPRTINAKRVKVYKDLGVNRISIGVQSFHDEIIKLSGRNHTSDKALKAIETVQEAGDFALNIDLLSGLAGETNETFAQSVETAIKLNVHNITVYRMEVYLNTDFFKQSVRKKLVELPTEEKEMEFIKIAFEKFNASNYKPWSFFTFTREGKFHHQYASNLWHGEDCCAIGPSAFGMFGRFHYQNTSSIESYYSTIESNDLPAIRGYKMSAKDIMLKDLLLGLKMEKFDLNHFHEKHGFDLSYLIKDTVDELTQKGFITIQDGILHQSLDGLLYGDYVGKRLANALKIHFGGDELSLY